MLELVKKGFEIYLIYNTPSHFHAK